MRRWEAIRACEKLGIHKENLIFMQFPDGSLQHNQLKLEWLVTKIILTYSPEEIFIPHRLEDNSDHVVTHTVVNHAIRKINQPVTVYEYLIWSWVQWPNISLHYISRSRQKIIKKIIRSAAGLKLLLATNRRVKVDVLLSNKKKALEEYKSQTQPVSPNSNYNTLENLHGGEFLKACFQNWEFFRYTSIK
jgi:LmbE family N-acetylglucosaminyl deacetylase